MNQKKLKISVFTEIFFALYNRKFNFHFVSLSIMKGAKAISEIRDLKMKAINKQMYDLAMHLRTIEKNISQDRDLNDEVKLEEFNVLYVLPKEELDLVIPLIREIKLTHLVK